MTTTEPHKDDDPIEWLVYGLILLDAVLLGIIVGVWFCARDAHANEYRSWLVLVVDASGSVNEQEYTFQRKAYVKALREPTVVAALSGTAVAILEFSAYAKVVVPFTDALSAAARYELNRSRIVSNSGTGVVDGLHLALDLLQDKPGVRTVDISADGEQNITGCDSFAPGPHRALAMRVQVNALIIEGEVPQCGMGTIARWYGHELRRVGFVMSVDHWRDFQHALENKLRLEISMLEIPQDEG